MSIAGCVASPPEDNFNTGAGDDCGGLAVGTTNVLYSGDTATVILPASNVASVTRVPLPRSIGLVSDLRSGEMYTLLDAAGVQQPTSSFPTGTITITQLGLLDGATGALTATRIALSQPLVLNASSNVGIYSGFGRVIFFTATTTADRGYYNVDLPSGLVVPIVTGTSVAAPPSAAICETFAHWGTAEFFGGEYHVLYVRTSPPVGVARLTPRTGVVDTALVADFAGSRGDICMAVFSPMNNRWYFHAEGIPTWLPSGTVAEVVGYCPGTWSAP